MEFYSSISELYDHIFPLKPARVDFVLNSLPKKAADILDIGCATGSLAIELNRHGHSVTGIDFDEDMIRRAKLKAADAGLSPSFIPMDMRNIPDNFSPRQFHAVLCCGNTLVHLTDLSAIRHFLAQTAVLLREKGVFLLQIINYDRILDGNIDGLPTIENDHILFKRNYSYIKSSGLIEFRTELMVKESGQKMKNSIMLYPLRKEELLDLLHPAGFRHIDVYGGFDGTPLTADSIPLIVSARI